MNDKKPIFDPREMVQQIRKPSLPGDLGRTRVFLGVLSLPLLLFEIGLDMSVEFEFLPKHIARIYRSYGDLPAGVDKIIMPQILSVSRLKGSAYRAKDFIVGEGREKFQNDLTDTLAKILAERRIIIHNTLIRHVNISLQILGPSSRPAWPWSRTPPTRRSRTPPANRPNSTRGAGLDRTVPPAGRSGNRETAS